MIERVFTRPILFNAEMVRAILAGRKTQSRRPISPQPAIPAARFVPYNLAKGLWLPETNSGKSGLSADWRTIKCPHGVRGDRLWVRETWGFSAELPASTRSEMDWLTFRDLRGYRADDPAGNWCWRPSIHMPRWASRITLEITDVRVQRLQEISDDDAVAEGVEETGRELRIAGRLRMEWRSYGRGTTCTSAQASFSTLWDSIYAPRGLSWLANPWVWVLTFQRIEGKR